MTAPLDRGKSSSENGLLRANRMAAEIAEKFYEADVLREGAQALREADRLLGVAVEQAEEACRSGWALRLGSARQAIEQVAEEIDAEVGR